MKYPKIYLAIDNCFASKRWTDPDDWMRVIKNAGVSYVEASADNECDPLYTNSEYIKSWLDKVRSSSRSRGVQVSSFYSGHGTYSTLGLAHPDSRIADHIQNNWLHPMMDMAGEADANIGFFCHAFEHHTLQEIPKYQAAKADLTRRLAELADYWAANNPKRYMAVEQMYTPHQIPWTIEGSEELIKNIYSRKKSAAYITIDTGHQVGQSRFLSPSDSNILSLFNDENTSFVWTGPAECTSIIQKVRKRAISQEQGLSDIRTLIDTHPFLFAAPKDCLTSQWLKKLGAFSPIIHLQQTNGKSSGHLAFDLKNNATGKIRAGEVISDLLTCYETANFDGTMPPPCEDIFLTLELFFPTVEYENVILQKLKESVKYWRTVIPEDGIRLDEAAKIAAQLAERPIKKSV